MKIERIFEKGVEKYLKTFSKPLGDRTRYIGASDIVACPRNVVLGKLTQQEPSTEDKVRFLRGHIAEEILVESLKQEGLKFETQPEFTHKEKSYIKVHPDIVFRSGNKIGIVEQKSVSSMPEEPHLNWVLQVNFQMGVVKSNFPDADVKGVIFCINVNTGEYKFFSIEDYSEELFKAQLNKAEYIWDAIEKGEKDNLDTDVTPLCAYCKFKKDCPEFSGDSVPDEVVELVEKYKSISKEIKKMNEKKDEVKNEIIGIIGDECTLKFDGHKVVSKPVVSEYIQSRKLKEKYPDVYKDVVGVREYTYFKVS